MLATAKRDPTGLFAENSDHAASRPRADGGQYRDRMFGMGAGRIVGVDGQRHFASPNVNAELFVVVLDGFFYLCDRFLPCTTMPQRFSHRSVRRRIIRRSLKCFAQQIFRLLPLASFHRCHTLARQLARGCYTFLCWPFMSKDRTARAGNHDSLQSRPAKCAPQKATACCLANAKKRNRIARTDLVSGRRRPGMVRKDRQIVQNNGRIDNGSRQDATETIPCGCYDAEQCQRMRCQAADLCSYNLVSV